MNTSATIMQKTDEETIREVERVAADIHFSRIEGPVTLDTPEVHRLAAKGEFYPTSGSLITVGGRKPKDIGMAYTSKGLVIAASQHEADAVAKEIPLDKILAYAGIRCLRDLRLKVLEFLR